MHARTSLFRADASASRKRAPLSNRAPVIGAFVACCDLDDCSGSCLRGPGCCFPRTLFTCSAALHRLHHVATCCVLSTRHSPLLPATIIICISASTKGKLVGRGVRVVRREGGWSQRARGVYKGVVWFGIVKEENKDATETGRTRRLDHCLVQRSRRCQGLRNGGWTNGFDKTRESREGWRTRDGEEESLIKEKKRLITARRRSRLDPCLELLVALLAETEPLFLCRVR